jgi:hypothetical protein
MRNSRIGRAPVGGRVTTRPGAQARIAVHHRRTPGAPLIHIKDPVKRH